MPFAMLRSSGRNPNTRLQPVSSVGGDSDCRSHGWVDGKVENVEITKGSPILRDPVIKALRKWSFSPFKVDGRVRRVKSTLAFDFQL